MNTELLKKIEAADFPSIMAAKGYKFFTSGKYNLNLIGVRANIEGESNDTFDDFLVVMYNDALNIPVKLIYPITTVPGKQYMLNPSNEKGVAILKPGQYPGVWKIDYHNGKYLALCQRGAAFVVYRDNNKDIRLDFDEATKEYGYFGINLHKAGENSQVIGANSAGCQVTQKSADFKNLMNLAETSKKVYGNSFTYTLLEENDL